MTATRIARDLRDMGTDWAIVAHQPRHTMRWAYTVSQADLRAEIAHRLLETITARAPDGYLLLARVRPRA
jgi:hypothetical protein